jgi:hypothetical protein
MSKENDDRLREIGQKVAYSDGKIVRDYRTPADVLFQRSYGGITGGCCERFANYSPCDCLSAAQQRTAQ